MEECAKRPIIECPTSQTCCRPIMQRLYSNCMTVRAGFELCLCPLCCIWFSGHLGLQSLPHPSIPATSNTCYLQHFRGLYHVSGNRGIIRNLFHKCSKRYLEIAQFCDCVLLCSPLLEFPERKFAIYFDFGEISVIINNGCP